MQKPSPELATALASLKPVILDLAGEFKYIIIDILDPASGAKLTVIRGSGKFEYHRNIFNHFRKTEFDPLNKPLGSPFKASCPGGGWVRGEPGRLYLYYKSLTYGRGDHQFAREIILGSPDFAHLRVDVEKET